MYGLTQNRELLVALAERLKTDHTLTGADVTAMCEQYKALPYWDVSLKGFEWDKDGNLVYPERPKPGDAGSNGSGEYATQE
eukprot:1719308-Pyramimonas_sp.AAC.1